MEKSQFNYRVPITTRWGDNDIYGHVNNVNYYAFFDSAVNRFLINKAGLDIHNSDVVAFVVSSKCDYLESVSYPQNIEVGVGVKKLGRSSVTYQLAIFKEGENKTIATGEFVHVFVDRKEQGAVSIPDGIRSALQVLVF